MNDDEPGFSPQTPGKASPRIWSVVLIFLAMLSLPLSLILSNHFTKSETEWLPVSLHSILESDYSIDPHSSRIPAVKLDLIKAAIRDQSAGEDPNRFEGVIISLTTPVATVKGVVSLASATPTASQPPTPSPTKTPTLGPVPTRTLRPTMTPTPTATRVTPTQTLKSTDQPTRPPRKPQPTNTTRPTNQPTREPTNQSPTKASPTESPPTREPTKPPPTRDPYPPPDPPKATQDPYP
jgi:hypothetical protein